MPPRPPPPALDEDDDEPAALAAAAARAAARLSQVVSKHTFVAAVKRKPIPANAAELVVRIRDSDTDNIVELGPPPPELAGVISQSEYVNDINEGVIGAVRSQLGPLSRRLFWGRVLSAVAILVGIGLIIGSVVRARDAYLAAEEAWLQAVNTAGRVLPEPDPTDYGPASNQPALFVCGILAILGGFAGFFALGWIGGTCGRGTAVRLLRNQVSRQLNRPTGRFKQRGLAFGVHVEDVVHLNYEPDLRTLMCEPEEAVYMAIRVMAPFPLRQPMTPASHGCVPDPSNPALSSGLVLSECGPLVVPDDCVPRPGDPTCAFVLVAGTDYCSPVNGSPAAAPVRTLPTELELIAAEEAAAASRIPTLGGGPTMAAMPGAGSASASSSLASHDPGPGHGQGHGQGIAMVSLPRHAAQDPTDAAADEDDVSISVSPVALAVGRRRVPVNAAAGASGSAAPAGGAPSAGGGSFALASAAAGRRPPPGSGGDGSSSGCSTSVATRSGLPPGISRVYRDAEADGDGGDPDVADGAHGDLVVSDEALYAPDGGDLAAAAGRFASASPLDGPPRYAAAAGEADGSGFSYAGDDSRGRGSSWQGAGPGQAQGQAQGRTKRGSRTGTEIAAIAASTRRRASGPAITVATGNPASGAAAAGGFDGAGGFADGGSPATVAGGGEGAVDGARRRGVSGSPAAPPLSQAVSRLPAPVAPPPAPPGIRIASNPASAIAAAAAAAQAAAAAAVSAVSQRNLLQSPSSAATGPLMPSSPTFGTASGSSSGTSSSAAAVGSVSPLRTVTARSLTARVMPRASAAGAAAAAGKEQ